MLLQIIILNVLIIKQIWEQRGRDASDKGTFLHDQIEKFYLDESYEEPDEFQLFRKFQFDHSSLVPHRTEWKIFDEEYEKKGHDYPIGYVRWTEKRNFETVLNSLSNNLLDVKTLITEKVKQSYSK